MMPDPFIRAKSFRTKSELIDTIIHEELHHRWWARGIIRHHPPGSEKEAAFYEEIESIKRDLGLR